MSIAIFSYIHSISRAQKLVLLTKGLVNELISSESWNSTVNVLKERGIIEEQPSSLEDFEYLMKKRAYDLLEKVRNYFSVFRITYNITDLYLYVMSLDEFKNIITSVINQRSNNNSIRFFKKYLDQLPSTIDELSNILKGTIYGEALSYALKEGQAKNLSLLLSLLDFYFIKKLSEIVESFRGDWKTYAENIICYYKDYYSISLAIKHKVSTGVGVEDRIIFKIKDIREGIDEKDVDAIFLDMPDPWNAIPKVSSSLSPSSPVVVFVPTVNQIEKTYFTMKELGFVDIHVEELLLREYQVKENAVRPKNIGVTHTGYIVRGRKPL
ncbi:hypothetical protein DJ531_09905 [Sulfolobus sp. A20-N-F6]|nr:hypothetical protein DJ531_09905 [Sulfolobus sp. A20-N-F6]